MMPCVVQLGRDPDLFSWDTGVLDTKTNFMLVAVRERSVDVTVACVEGCFDCFADFIGGGSV